MGGGGQGVKERVGRREGRGTRRRWGGGGGGCCFS